jgi:flagellar biosynthesis protein FliR
VGFLNRVTPQLSIFNIGFPLTVVGGLAVFLVSLPGVARCFAEGLTVLQSELSVLVGI